VITAPAYIAGVVAGATFTAGEATVDDATDAGKRSIEFAKRRGWGVAGGIATAVEVTVAQGKPVADWTTAELTTYLNANRVQFPSGASKADKLAAAQDAFEAKAQGGAAANLSAGHLMGTMPPEGAPIVPGDDAAKAALWRTPMTGNVSDDVAPTISVQPSGSSKITGATATYEVTAAGTPAPTYQWQRQALGTGAYVNIAAATAATYTTPGLTVATKHNDRYRVGVSNSDGSVTSTAYQQAVTAS